MLRNAPAGAATNLNFLLRLGLYQNLANGLIVETSNGYAQQSPWLQISNKAQQMMFDLLKELGLTPASRGKVPVQEQSDGKWDG